MRTKSYVHCPNCHTRMKRTGKKREETEVKSSEPLYLREYKCSNCNRLWRYSESRNIFF